MLKEKRLVLWLLVGLLIAATASFFVYYKFFFTNIESVRSDVKRLYELANPGITAEVVSVTADGGLYKVLVKLSGVTGTVNYAEAWVSRDGSLLTQTVIRVKESVNQMQKLKNFVDCLSDKGVRIVGILNQTLSQQGAQATLLQLNILGAYSPKIYVSCDLNLQACLAANVTQVPSVIYNNNVLPGFKSIPDLESISGCKLG